MPLSIIHVPLGLEHPSHAGPQERVPRFPRVGEGLRIGACTRPAGGTRSVWVTWWTGRPGTPDRPDPPARVDAACLGDAPEEQIGPWTVETTGSAAAWAADLPPCPAAHLHYQIHAEGPAGSVSSEVFSVLPRQARQFGPVESARIVGNRLIISHGKPGFSALPLVQVFSESEPDTLCIEVALGEEGADHPLPSMGEAPALERETTRAIGARFGTVRLLVDRATGAVSISEAGGKTILREIDPPAACPGESPGTIEVERCFRSQSKERFYGLGERFHALNQRGSTVDTVVMDHWRNQGRQTYFPVPFLISSIGYGYWIDTPRNATFDLAESRPDRWRARASGRSLRSFVSLGPPAPVLGSFVARTGKPSPLPDWVWGPWMSSNEWNSQARVMQEVEKTVELDIPASVVVVEAWSDEQTFYLWNDAHCAVTDPGAPIRYQDLSFPPGGKWTDPRGMIRSFHDKGIRFVLWQVPVLKPLVGDHALHEADEEHVIRNGLCVTEQDGSPYRIRPTWFHGGLAFDFTNPKARQWWFAKRRYLLDECGVDGFKTDGGEHLWGAGLRFSDGRTGAEMTNGFPPVYLEAYHEALKETGHDRPVTFSRSGFTGAQRFPCHWAGDQESTWEEFRSVVRAALNAGLSGIPFFGWDLAGFSGEMPTAELYMRSAACAALSPIMQYHSEFNARRVPSMDRTPWNVAERTSDAGVIPAYRLYAKLRMRLLPYLVAEADHCVQTGEPMMAPLLFRWPEDAAAWKVEDQYLFGRSLLVAPILEPSITKRSVYLPAGAWEDVWSGKQVKGPRRLVAAAPFERIPVYRLAGAPWPFASNPFAEMS